MPQPAHIWQGYDAPRSNSANNQHVQSAARKLFQIMADAAPVMIWQCGPDKLATYFNKAWLDFSGRSIEQQAGEGWTEGVHPDDLEYRLATYRLAFDARQDFEMDYRLRRHDGEYRWILERGAPVHAHSGQFLGYIGGCIDITERKRGDTEKQVAVQDHALQTFFVIALVARAALDDLPPSSLGEPAAIALAQVVDLASAGTAYIRCAISA
jgi:PAS domain S-box-containing protein